MEPSYQAPQPVTISSATLTASPNPYTPPQPIFTPKQQSWSWGGAILYQTMFLATKSWVDFVIYIILMCIPFVNIVAMIGYFLYYGKKGHDYILQSGQFKTPEEARGFITGLDNAGKASMYIMTMFTILGLLLFATVGVSLFGAAIHSSTFTGTNGH